MQRYELQEKGNKSSKALSLSKIRVASRATNTDIFKTAPHRILNDADSVACCTLIKFHASTKNWIQWKRVGSIPVFKNFAWHFMIELQKYWRYYWCNLYNVVQINPTMQHYFENLSTYIQAVLLISSLCTFRAFLWILSMKKLTTTFEMVHI